jgi:hypothetical protein
MRLFLDDAQLPAGKLWSNITDAMECSRWLILVASPAAANRPWVIDEVTHWLSLGRIENLVVVIADGNVTWDRDAGDFDWSVTDALPDVMANAFTEAPRWVDLKWAAKAVSLTSPSQRASGRLSSVRLRAWSDSKRERGRSPEWLDAVAEIAAPILGRQKDDLVGEDLRQYRRTRLFARGAIVGMAGLTTAAVVFGVLALQQRGAALSQRNEARRQAAIATSRLFASQASSAISSDLPGALIRARGAYATWPTPEASAALLGTLEGAGHLTGAVRLPGTTITSIASRPTSGLVVVGASHGAIASWVRPGREGPPVPGPRVTLSDTSPVGQMVFTPDGRRLLAVTSHGSIVVLDGTTLRQLASGRIADLPSQATQASPSTVAALSVESQGRWAAVAYGVATDTCPRKVAVIALSSGRVQRVLDLTPPGCIQRTGFRPGGVLEVTSDILGNRFAWRVGSWKRLPNPRRFGGLITTLNYTYSPDGRHLAALYRRRAGALDVDAGRPPNLKMPLRQVDALAFDPSSSVLVGVGDSYAALWRTRSPTRSPQLIRGVPSGTPLLSVTDDENFVTARNDVVLFWSTRARFHARLFEQGPDHVAPPAVAFAGTAVSSHTVAWISSESGGDLYAAHFGQGRARSLGRGSPIEMTFDSSGAALYMSNDSGDLGRVDASSWHAEGVPLEGDARSTTLHATGVVEVGDDALRVWSLSSGRLMASVPLVDELRFDSSGGIPAGERENLALYRDGTRGVLIDRGRLWSWDARARSFTELPGKVKDAFSAAVHVDDEGDGFVAEEGRVRDLRSGRLLAQIPQQEWGQAPAFSPSGRVVVTRTAEEQAAAATVWRLDIRDARTLEQIGAVRFRSAFENSIDVALGGEDTAERLAVTGAGGAASVWPLAPSDWADRACNLAGAVVSSEPYRLPGIEPGAICPSGSGAS